MIRETADIIRLAVLVRLAATDGDEDAVSVWGVGHVRLLRHDLGE